MLSILAIGVIIGGAFGGLVNSVVNDILMPIVAYLTGGVDFHQQVHPAGRRPGDTLEEAREAGATLAYGNFLTLLINFLIIAWVLFMVVKAMNAAKKPAPEAAPAAPPAQEVLLGRNPRPACQEAQSNILRFMLDISPGLVPGLFLTQYRASERGKLLQWLCWTMSGWKRFAHRKAALLPS